MERGWPQRGSEILVLPTDLELNSLSGIHKIQLKGGSRTTSLLRSRMSFNDCPCVPTLEIMRQACNELLCDGLAHGFR
jgi:hypothetical protein